MRSSEYNTSLKLIFAHFQTIAKLKFNWACNFSELPSENLWIIINWTADSVKKSKNLEFIKTADDR